MMKRIALIVLIVISVFCGLYGQGEIVSGMDGAEFRNTLNANFDTAYNNIESISQHLPPGTIIAQDSGGTTFTALRTFMGFRGNGDSIFLEGTGIAMNNNRLVRPYSSGIGNQAVVEGYMSVSAGTNTIGGANDALAAGNESMTGHRFYFYDQLTLGHDGNNYVLIDGDEFTGLSGQTLRAIGDQSSYFISEVDSGAYAWESRVFWDYPVFWTNLSTRDYPSGSSQKIGPAPLYCDSVVYIEADNDTKVYYSDSIFSLGNSGWITDCRQNNSGTGQLAAGKYTATIGEGATAVGYRTSTSGTGAMATGYETYAGANGAFSQGIATQATALGSAAFNKATEASGLYSAAFGEENVSDKRGSVTFGRYAKPINEYDLAFSSAQFSQTGDAVGIKSIQTGESPGGAGPYIASYATVEEHTAYTGHTVVTAVQTDHRPGRIGEAGSWILSWGFSVDDKYVIDSVNTTLDRIYFHGDSLFYDDLLAYNAYTDSTMNTNGTVIGGLSGNYALWVVDGDSVSWISVSTSQGGGVRDLTSEQEAQYHVLYRYYVHDDALTLIDASFADDGDVVGNHTSTGIRPIMYGRISYHSIRYYVYGLADRNIRWVFNTDATIVKTE